MSTFKNAIIEAKEWKLDAYVSGGKLVVKKRGGNQIIARISADGSLDFPAPAGYHTSVPAIAAKVVEAGEVKNVAPVGNTAGFCGTSKRDLNNIARYGYDAIEM